MKDNNHNSSNTLMQLFPIKEMDVHDNLHKIFHTVIANIIQEHYNLNSINYKVIFLPSILIFTAR